MRSQEVLTMKQESFVDLYTPQGAALSGQPWNCYPRPQLRRGSFLNLNGTWDFTVSPAPTLPEHYDRNILVPYPPESLLSGVHQIFPEGHYLYYRTTFSLPDGFLQDRVLLHFGAVDQIATVYLNGTQVGEHTGGYEAFSFDITPFLQPENTLVVRVVDHLSRQVLPYGKQCHKRGGMWYTPASGIWQTVWLESVPTEYIRSIKIQPTMNQAYIQVTGVSQGILTVTTPQGAVKFPVSDGQTTVTLENPRLWSPEDPYLYEFTIQAGQDTVTSYFALRTLTVRTVNGYPRLCLNGKPYFFHGILDQGYWSDGLFTPAHPSCYEQDILAMKSLGFNMLRKHIKIEAEQFYYDCDRLGMVVFQDMINNGDYNFLRDTALPTIGWKHRNDRWMHRDKQTREQFLLAMEQTVRQLENHPCICYWTIFNEGWGQFNSAQAYHRLKELDSSRFIDTTSGWFFSSESDVVSEHIYFKPFRAYPTQQPLVLSEFGGYSLTPDGHAFNPSKEYGYRHFEQQSDYEQALAALYEEEIIPAMKQGLCAAVYTQVSDVEDETNGLLSYDRVVQKVSPQVMLPIAQKLIIPDES